MRSSKHLEAPLLELRQAEEALLGHGVAASLQPPGVHGTTGDEAEEGDEVLNLHDEFILGGVALEFGHGRPEGAEWLCLGGLHKFVQVAEHRHPPRQNVTLLLGEEQVEQLRLDHGQQPYPQAPAMWS